MRMSNTGRSSIKRLVSYLMNPQGNAERVLSWRITNCLEGIRQNGEDFVEDDMRLAAVAMQITQKRNTRATGDRTYHLVVSFRERPDEALARRVEDELCSALGFQENERVSVLHGDTDNIHLHVAINKIHLVTRKGTRIFDDGMREYLGRWSSGSDSAMKAFLRKSISREFILNGSDLFRDRIFRMLRQYGFFPRFMQPDVDAAWRRQRYQAWTPPVKTRNHGRE